MICTDIGHQQAWSPEEPGLYQATAYGLIMTSKENQDKYMTAKGVAGGAGRAFGRGVGELRRRGGTRWK